MSYRLSGLSLIEALIVIAIIAILASFAIPSMQKFYRVYKFNEYSFELESLVRWARIAAIEKGINTSICVNGQNIVVYNETTSKDPSCSGDVLKELVIRESWITPSIYVALGKSGLMFDPRGFAIFGGNICITDGNRYYKVILQSDRGAITVEGGKGGCS